MEPVTVYTLRGCHYCWRAKRLLRRKGIEFEEIPTAGRASPRTRELRTELAQRFESTTFPQVLIGDRYIGGLRQLAALDRAGELERLRDQAPEGAGPGRR